ncbi:MAG TPA: class A beta-lactamase, subclass A2 [Pyrinomonadaceae bacterium]|nr:class A beta-lactamase, subclass A2 [Pyrinomonadaceae bacterium]
MRKIIYILLFISLISACSNSVTSQENNQKVNSANSQETKKDKKQDDDLQKQIEQIASAAKGRVGVTAAVLETGEAVSLNPKEQFPMQSVYKLPIGMAVLHQVDEGKIKLDQSVKVEKSNFVRQGQYSPIRDKNPNGVELSVKELLRFAVSESDGTASDVLLDLVGAEAVKQYLDEIGVKNIIVANSEKEIGRDWETQYRNWASPEGAVELLRALQERRGGLSEQNQVLLLKFMTESPTGPRRLKGLLPKRTIVAHKTGTSGNRDGITAATNDIGIITLPNGRHLAIAVFVSNSPADEKTREEAIAKIAKAVWDKWSK